MAENGADSPPQPPQVPVSPCWKDAPLSPYLFHADHFANTHVQLRGDHCVLWLQVLGGLLHRLCSTKEQLGHSV